MKNNDRWSQLSINEKADLIKLYTGNGVTNIKDIKTHYNSFAPGGPIETDEYGYPADITPAVVTQDPEFNKFLMTLPDNLRLTPEKDYYLYKSWKMNGRPRNFQEGLEANMYNWDDSDNSYHGVTVIGYDENGVGIFGKPKHHDTVHYELDWYNKGIGTLEGGKQYPLQGEERKEWEDFKSQYQLDSTGVDYKYVPKKQYNSFEYGGDAETLYYDDTYIEPAIVKAFKSNEEYNRFLGEKGARIVREGTNKFADVIGETLRYSPIIGDVMDGVDAYEEAKAGDVTKAGILAGTLLLPNALEKPIKALGKGVKNLRLYNRYTKDGERFRDAVDYAVNKYAKRADIIDSNYGGTVTKRKVNTGSDVLMSAQNTPISIDFRMESLFPKIGGNYNSATDEIWLNKYRPALIKKAWKSPKEAIKILKGTGAHEGTHLALNHLNDKLTFSVPGSYPVANIDHPLYDRVGYAFSDPNRKATTWQRSPEEMVANMTKASYNWGIDPLLNTKNWSPEYRSKLARFLEKNHGFTNEDAIFLADELSSFGYKNGGELNIERILDGNTETNQNLSNIPVYYDGTVITPAIVSTKRKPKKKLEDELLDVILKRDEKDGNFVNVAWDLQTATPSVKIGGNTNSIDESIRSYFFGEVPELFKPAIMNNFNNLPNMVGGAFNSYSGGGSTQVTTQSTGSNMENLSLTPQMQKTNNPVLSFLQAVQQGQQDERDKALEGMPKDLYDAWKESDRQYHLFKTKIEELKQNNQLLDKDESELVDITAPNTEISKFIFGNKVSQNAINEIIRVSKLREQDPYDVLAHMLIEYSGRPLKTNSYFNTHNVIEKQLNSRLTDYFFANRLKQIKQFGIYKDGKTQYTAEEIKKATEKMTKEREEALSKVIVPESHIDAVALYMLLHGRDFNPAQKSRDDVNNNYLDMIDSAIVSLKENMPNLFD